VSADRPSAGFFAYRIDALIHTLTVGLSFALGGVRRSISNTTT